MLKKSYSKTRKSCRVTFKLPAEVKAKNVILCGDFNDWDKNTSPMKKLKDGSFSQTLSLNSDKEYRFRYLLDGSGWENDWEADKYKRNVFGSEDSVIVV